MGRIRSDTRQKLRRWLLETAAEHFAERRLAGARVRDCLWALDAAAVAVLHEEEDFLKVVVR